MRQSIQLHYIGSYAPALDIAKLQQNSFYSKSTPKATIMKINKQMQQMNAAILDKVI